MVDKAKLISSLYGLVGSRQPLDSTFPTLDANNKVSRSGYYVNDNPFAKLELLLDTQNYPSIDATNFNALLKQIQENSITNLINSVFTDVDYIERKMLFDFANNKIESSVLTGFVGRRFRMSGINDIAFIISRVILEFKGTGTLKLLLFNTGKSTPIYTKSVAITSNYQSVTLNWVCDNTVEYKGDFIIGYIATAGLEPYEREYERANIKNSFTHIFIQDIQVPNHTTETLWDLTDEEGLSEECGLNLDITLYRDYTNLTINNEHLFAKALNMQFCISIVEQYVASMRSGINERLSKDILNRAVVYLEGQTEPNIVGLKTSLGYEIKSLRKEIKRLTDNYLPNNMTIATLS